MPIRQAETSRSWKGAQSGRIGRMSSHPVNEMQAKVFASAEADRRAWRVLRRRWPYGTLLFVLNGVVVQRLSAAAGAPMPPSWIVGSSIVHVWLVGVPVALATCRASSAAMRRR